MLAKSSHLPVVPPVTEAKCQSITSCQKRRNLQCTGSLVDALCRGRCTFHNESARASLDLRCTRQNSRCLPRNQHEGSKEARDHDIESTLRLIGTIETVFRLPSPHHLPFPLRGLVQSSLSSS